MICTAGLEFRDYPTLIEAVRGLDARVVIAAASPWSKRADATAERRPPGQRGGRAGSASSTCASSTPTPPSSSCRCRT